MHASVLRYAYAYDGDSSWRSDLWGDCPYARPRLEVVTSLTAVPKVTLAKWCYRIWKHKPFTVFLLATCGYMWLLVMLPMAWILPPSTIDFLLGGFSKNPIWSPLILDPFPDLLGDLLWVVTNPPPFFKHGFLTPSFLVFLLMVQ